MFDKDAIKQLTQAEAITAAADAIKRQAESLVALPQEFNLHNLEKYQENRRRQRATMTTSVLSSFAAYALDNASDKGKAVFVDPDNMAAVAVLNMGSTDLAGHCDHQAKLQLKPTAAYSALLQMASGMARKQQDVAEWLEDWAPHIICVNSGNESVPLPLAVGSVRNISIEALKTMASSENDLQSSRSSFDQVKATNTDNLPTQIKFTAPAFHGLGSRAFAVRLGILTGDKPQLVLRIINLQQHQEDMAQELAQLVMGAIGGEMPVHIGVFRAGE